MNKYDVISNKLMARNDYTNEFISAAAELMSEYGYDIDTCNLFPDHELKVILDAEKYLKDKPNSEYNIKELIALDNATKMELCLTSWMKNIPNDIIKKYLSVDIPFIYSNYALQGYIDKHADFSKYMKQTDSITREMVYNIDQFYEIFAGISSGIDVSIYDDPSYDAKLMLTIRTALTSGVDPSNITTKKYKTEDGKYVTYLYISFF